MYETLAGAAQIAASNSATVTNRSMNDRERVHGASAGSGNSVKGNETLNR